MSISNRTNELTTVVAVTLLATGVVIFLSALYSGCYSVGFGQTDSFSCNLIENSGLSLTIVDGIGTLLSWMERRM